jgi:hypothetical protein
MNQSNLEAHLLHIASGYKSSFAAKTYGGNGNDLDPLMDAFGITPGLKRENRQYWGRELGMCWQVLVVTLFTLTCKDFAPPLRLGADEPCDCRLGADAIDTKYRVGSGDSGTLKKFRTYGKLLVEKGYRPVLLFLRRDNLKAAITACVQGGWTVLTADESFQYIGERTRFDLESWLRRVKASGELLIER